jgi:hypothetical protein
VSNVCVAIGVGDAPPLDYLRGAVNGATAVAEWASQPDTSGAPRYETHLLTDEVAPVEFSDLATALQESLVAGAERLLIYFAGHGLSTAAADDLWLLSRWDQTRQGVSVAGLRDRLMRYGVKQLVIVSDACRSIVTAETRDVVANPVLDRGPFNEAFPQMDSWFAASPARAAYMIPGKTPAEARCVFSGLFVEALRGAHAQAFEGGSLAGHVTNFSLADFLEQEVSVVAGHYKVTLRPVITTSIRPPRNVYLDRVPTPTPQAEPWPDPVQVTVAGMGGGDASARIEPRPGQSWTTAAGDASILRTTGGGSSRGPKPEPSEVPGDASGGPSLSELGTADAKAMEATDKAATIDIAAAMTAFQGEHRPDHFESGAGFTVVGAEVSRGLLGRPAQAVRLGDTPWWRVEPHEHVPDDPWWSQGWPIRAPLPLLVELGNGQWVGAAVLPRFVLTFTMGDTGAEAVIFRSMDIPKATETEQVMAELRVRGLAQDRAADVVGRLRGAKHTDPMLGVIAAYLHDSMGDLANVLRTAYFFAERGEAVPFDIAVLGRLRARRDPNGLVRVAIPAVQHDEDARGTPSCMRVATPEVEGVLGGAFPWMRQGWVRLDPFGQDGLYPAGMAAIGAHLLPSSFTTLDAAGGAKLADMLFGGD